MMQLLVAHVKLKMILKLIKNLILVLTYN